MKTGLRQGEQISKEGPASLQRNVEAVGGLLYLTARRLVFEPHTFNVQRESFEVELSELHSTRTCWSKVLGIIPIFPNSLAVFTKQGKEHRFVLLGRNAWAAAIGAQRSQ